MPTNTRKRNILSSLCAKSRADARFEQWISLSKQDVVATACGMGNMLDIKPEVGLATVSLPNNMVGFFRDPLQITTQVKTKFGLGKIVGFCDGTCEVQHSTCRLLRLCVPERGMMPVFFKHPEVVQPPPQRRKQTARKCRKAKGQPVREDSKQKRLKTVPPVRNQAQAKGPPKSVAGHKGMSMRRNEAASFSRAHIAFGHYNKPCKRGSNKVNKNAVSLQAIVKKKSNGGNTVPTCSRPHHVWSKWKLKGKTWVIVGIFVTADTSKSKRVRLALARPFGDGFEQIKVSQVSSLSPCGSSTPLTKKETAVLRREVFKPHVDNDLEFPPAEPESEESELSDDDMEILQDDEKTVVEQETRKQKNIVKKPATNLLGSRRQPTRAAKKRVRDDVDDSVVDEEDVVVNETKAKHDEPVDEPVASKRETKAKHEKPVASKRAKHDKGKKAPAHVVVPPPKPEVHSTPKPVIHHPAPAVNTCFLMCDQASLKACTPKANTAVKRARSTLSLLSFFF